MDPKACLVRLLTACADDDRDEAVAALDDLKDWFDAMGHLPRVMEIQDPNKFDFPSLGHTFHLPEHNNQ